MPDIELSSNRRRIVLDWTLALAVVACIMAFADLRATVTAQTKAFEAVTKRLDDIETRATAAPANAATKGDISRLEGRIDQLVSLMLTQRPAGR
jgi:hypothetical protein